LPLKRNFFDKSVADVVSQLKIMGNGLVSIYRQSRSSSLKEFKVRSEVNALLCRCIVALLMFVNIDCFAQERFVYKCTNAAGVSEFTDKECMGGATQIDLKVPADEDYLRQKAEHDARVSHDKALADQLQATRLAEEQAARAAQGQQMQSNRALADKFEQERTQKNSSVVSSPNVTQPAPIITLP
jgi:hypothetical protein